MCILVVDDDDLMTESLRYILERAGYEVQTAGDGCEALERLRDDVFDLVITDWRMPRMGGPELCQAIRNDDSLDYVYLILLTAHSAEKSAAEGISAGADDFIVKPFDTEELLARVRAGQRVLSAQAGGLMIFALAKLAESRDDDTGVHLQRARSYARIIATDLHRQRMYPEVDANFVRLIHETSPLHDIGKVAIPDSILLKPGKLTGAEFEIMETHTLVGGEILEDAYQHYPGANFLCMARDIAISHHEKYDGSGYPRGLVANEIPLNGRIMAIADVYDVLTSKRVYKPAFGHDRSKSIILEGSGRHFDPMLVEAFLRNETEFDQIRKSFMDEDVDAVRIGYPMLAASDSIRYNRPISAYAMSGAAS